MTYVSIDELRNAFESFKTVGNGLGITDMRIVDPAKGSDGIIVTGKIGGKVAAISIPTCEGVGG